MSTCSHHPLDRDRSHIMAVPTLRAGIIGVAADLLAIVRAQYLRRRGRRVATELLTMTDAQLRDIGITASDIDEALRVPGEDPTLCLHRIARNRRNHWLSAR